MASPFKVFRKHQKVMLAVFGVLIMLSFAFGTVISELLSSRQSQNPVAVKTGKYGNLRQSDLYFMRQDRFKVLAILARIHATALVINPESSHKWFEKLLGTASDEDLVNTWLKSRRAEEIGMVVSDQVINDFLQRISNSKLTARDISAIIKQEGLTDSQFFDIMRDELRALEVAQFFLWSLEGITPAQRWEYFRQLRKQASVELIPVEVEPFLAQIKDPGEDELKVLFEKYKGKLPRPDSPDPGFRIPHKIDVQYIKADFAKFSEPGAISEEEIQSTYEKNRAYFDQFDKQPDASLTPGEKNAAEKDKKETASAGAQSQEQPKEQPSEKQTPADQPAAPQKKSPQEDTKKSSAIDRSPFRLTAMAAEAGKPGEDKTAVDKPAEGLKAENPAANQPAQPEKTVPESAESSKASVSEAAAEKTEKAKAPLSDKMKERVRAVVARGKIQEKFAQLQQIMEENGKKWRKYEAEKIQQKKAVTPPKLDFEALAKKFGLTAGQTGLISTWETQNFDIGLSLVEGVSPFEIAVYKSIAEFKPALSMDVQGNGYLFWKVNDIPESAPSFDDKDVRQQVVHTWKLIQARALARQEAKRLAETAGKSNATLKEGFGDNPSFRVITPPPFSILSESSVPRGSSPASIRLSTVEGVPMVGLDFMRDVFNLEQNQIGTAMNLPQTVVYVVQPIGYSPPQDALWKIFLAEDFSRYATVARYDLEADNRAWLEALKTSAGLQWEIKPEQQRAESASGSSSED